ncbi:MAG: hypothetical protein FWD01_03150 [Defluviitaleaceae bacterium]|nr:hypothetical protein [Defluviitaleaceae bacterium]
MPRGITPVAVLGDVLLSAVTSETVTHSSEVTDKAVEDGQDIADHMKEKPDTVSISGVIVGENAWTALARIRQMRNQRELVTYTNRNIFTSMAITNINTDHDKTIAGGCKFNITLKHVRRAVPSVVQLTSVLPAVATKAAPSQNAGTQQPRRTNKQSNNKASDLRLAAASRGFRGGSVGGGLGLGEQISIVGD